MLLLVHMKNHHHCCRQDRVEEDVDAGKATNETMVLPVVASDSSHCNRLQKRRQQQQHLIRFQNRTYLCETTAHCDQTSSPSSTSLQSFLLYFLSQVTGWQTRFLEICSTQPSPLESSSSIVVYHHRARAISCIRGGKGGFGSLLKSQSRQAGARSTTHFGACRDLQGRRLRHVNDQVTARLRRQFDQRKNDGSGSSQKVHEDWVRTTTLETPTGLPGWHLQLPAWSDVSKRERRKWKLQYRKWQREQEAARQKQAREREMRESQVQQYVDRASEATASIQSSLESALQEGLEQQRERAESNKRQKKQQQDDNGGEENEKDPPVALVTLSGDAVVVAAKDGDKDVWQVQSQSNFCTIGIVLQPTSPTTTPKDRSTTANPQKDKDSSKEAASSGNDTGLPRTILYWEVLLVTGGLAQIGWAQPPSPNTATSTSSAAGWFAPNSETGDGVGDDAYSYAYDGSRGICLHQSQSQPYGSGTGSSGSNPRKWKAGDTVGCWLDLQRGEISYSLNGESLGVAYKIDEETTSSSSKEQLVLFPAASCNPQEILQLHLHPKDMVHMPKDVVGADGERRIVTAVGDLLANTNDNKFVLDMEADDEEEEEEEDVAGANGKDDKQDSAQPAEGDKKEEGAQPSQSGEKPATKAAAAPIVVVEPISLDGYTSAQELQALGLDRLKGALMAIGVKCGGTLEQRAERLFSLKGLRIPEDIPPELLAKKDSRKRKAPR